MALDFRTGKDDFILSAILMDLDFWDSICVYLYVLYIYKVLNH